MNMKGLLGTRFGGLKGGEMFIPDQKRTKKSLISRNPHIQFGDYCVRGTRITVSAIKAYHKGGDSIGSIAKDYNITEEQVVAALEFRKRTK